MTILASTTLAQTQINETPTTQKGFMIGIGLGAGVLSLKTNTISQAAFSTTLPNIKVGYRFNKSVAILALLPGATYIYLGKTRGFEALMVAAQYWVQNRWWILCGGGLTFDAPAFYTVKDPKTAGFYTGFPAMTIATGYEIWHRKHFSLDLHYRMFYGTSHLPNKGLREGISNMLLFGFNWK